MSNEIRVVDELGQVITVPQLRDKSFLKHLPDDDLESIAYTAKTLKNPIKNIDDEIKTRLSKGAQFVHISQVETTRQLVDNDNDQTKADFYKKYGLEAFVLKTPAQLKKQFGESIKEDLDRIVVYEKSNRVKYD